VEALRWPIRARDRHGRLHRGIAVFTSRTSVAAPEPPAEFQVVLLAAAQPPRRIPEATAFCMPAFTKDAALAGPSSAPTLAQLKRGELPPTIRAQFAAGRIIHAGGELLASVAFPHGADTFDLERLALMLVEQRQSEALAPYLAILRRELRLSPGVDAPLALRVRLDPADADERPPARAPAIMRLRRLQKALDAGRTPLITLEQLTEDLRFLMLFERQEHVLRRDALDRLLGDVLQAPTKRTATRARVFKLHPRKGAR
jgi:hypothetical protein